MVLRSVSLADIAALPASEPPTARLSSRRGCKLSYMEETLVRLATRPPRLLQAAEVWRPQGSIPVLIRFAALQANTAALPSLTASGFVGPRPHSWAFQAPLDAAQRHWTSAVAAVLLLSIANRSDAPKPCSAVRASTAAAGAACRCPAPGLHEPSRPPLLRRFRRHSRAIRTVLPTTRRPHRQLFWIEDALAALDCPALSPRCTAQTRSPATRPRPHPHPLQPLQQQLQQLPDDAGGSRAPPPSPSAGPSLRLATSPPALHQEQQLRLLPRSGRSDGGDPRRTDRRCLAPRRPQDLWEVQQPPGGGWAGAAAQGRLQRA